ncbi:MAG: TSUP family transporter, partial [Caulobacteraceae bacterium]
GFAGRALVSGAERLSFKALFVISLAGGVAGGFLLLATPPSFFAMLLPWLVLMATGFFAWGSFFRKTKEGAKPVGPFAAGAVQFLIAVYGGYFGGGIGFLMLAALTIAGLPVRAAGATKNVLAGVMNGAAVLIFVFTGHVHWLAAVAVGAGAIVGGLLGVWLLKRVNERALRIGVVVLGLALAAGLFWEGA